VPSAAFHTNRFRVFPDCRFGNGSGFRVDSYQTIGQALRHWREMYTQHQREEKTMSRSNPTEGARNPATRWFEWAGGSDGGFIRWYDKEAKMNVKVEGTFTFLVLDELSTVKGWHEPSQSAIYANEVRDTRQEVLVVRSFKGDELANGVYQHIKDRIAAKGGHYVASIYIAYKQGEELKLGNLGLKGAAAGAWMEFKRNATVKKDANGRLTKSYFVDAVKIAGFENAKKGATAYRVPIFKLLEVSAATNEQAIALDAELQAYLTEYLKRPKAEAAKPHEDDEAPFDAYLTEYLKRQKAEAAKPHEDDEAPFDADPGTPLNRDNLDDDIPF
jgi:hypothetical protein